MLTRAGLRTFVTSGARVINDVAKQQFMTTYHDGVNEATLEYKLNDKTIEFLYTNVPTEFQGKGVGKVLAKFAFDHASEKNLSVIVKCHFLAAFYNKNKSSYNNLNVKIHLDD